MEKILKGVLTYRHSHRLTLLKEFQRIKANPEPTAVFFSCMDSRLFPPQFTTARVGDMFVVRNAGNLIPHAPNEQYETITTEPAALELGVIRNNIRDVVVCGHSDCKAMNLLYGLRNQIHEHRGPPLEVWVKKHGTASVLKYEIFSRYPKEPLQFYAAKPFLCYIDPEDKFAPADKFSQVNCLQQLQNIHSYSFLQERIRSGFLRVHAMWFDIYTGDVFLYSQEKRRYLLIDDTTLDHLIRDSTNVVLPEDKNNSCHHDHGHHEHEHDHDHGIAHHFPSAGHDDKH